MKILTNKPEEHLIEEIKELRQRITELELSKTELYQAVNEKENIIATLSSGEDITERKRIEEALCESEELYRKLFQQSVEAIYIFDPETKRILETNNAFIDLLGYTAEEVRALTLYDFVVHKKENIDAYIYHILTSGAIIVGERVWRRKDKTMIDLWVTASKIQQKGKSLCFVVAHDITERKRAEEELYAAKDRLQTFSKSSLKTLENERRYIAREMHDEIGQELTALRINLENMQHLSNPTVYMNHTNENIATVEHLIQKVRNLSFDLRPPILDDLGLVPALRWYFNRLEENAELSIHFVVNFSDHRLSTEIETACFRVVQEALTNVVRHAKARQVTVELKQEEKRVKLTVSDDGIGFDVTSTQKRASLGESFGLLGMQERVALVGGTIEIESILSRGTKVAAFFPLSES
jgi:PAS domain S-box-containing protein